MCNKQLIESLGCRCPRRVFKAIKRAEALMETHGDYDAAISQAFQDSMDNLPPDPSCAFFNCVEDVLMLRYAPDE